MLRKALLWIIVALLPLQGYAAAAMISCGPMHARMSAVAHHDGAEHDHAAHENAAHEHAAHEHATHEHAACSACASCCTAPAAPAPGLLLLGMHPSHGEAIPFFATSEDSIVPDRLDRPPRILLA